MEIKICPVCNGDGRIVEIDFKKSDFVPCNNCNSSGRVLSKIYTLELPFTEREKFFELDNKIYKIIRKE